MSERFQKTFISAHEFVESWNKEIYELNHLDFFIYLMINHLGNQLERRFFIQDKRVSPYFLEFDQIGTLCFNIGDTFEYFLEDNCFGSCNLNCPNDLDKKVDIEKAEMSEQNKQNIIILQSFLSNELEKEQCLRIDLMNHVILDSLLQFYSDEFQVEFEEDDLYVLELAEFIEDVVIDFIRMEGQTLLHKPFDTAIEYFEDLLHGEEDESQENEWIDFEESWEVENRPESWQTPKVLVNDVFFEFLSSDRYNPAEQNGSLNYDLAFFRKYLREFADVKNIFEINEYHLGEFFSYWLPQQFVLGDEKQISHIFRAMARFITFLFQKYKINLKKDFLRYYEALKLNLPRVIQATNQFLAEYDLLEALLSTGQPEIDQISGAFEITNISERPAKRLDLMDIHFLLPSDGVMLNSSAFSRLHKGDIIVSNIVKKDSHWEIIDIQFIYPAMARPYIH